MNGEITVADASCLIVLQNIGELSLLQNFSVKFLLPEKSVKNSGLLCRSG
jgi:predicted nucleic acid-binding protein